MYVAVGSENPVKIAATEDALSVLAGVTVGPVAVDSGVPEQPWGRPETIEGAVTRASRAYESGEYDLGVGIEGGVAETGGTSGLSLIMWAAVTDGERVARGGGPTIPLPEHIAERLHAGEELGPVLDDTLSRDGVARQEGAAGVLTGNAITRRSSLTHAVAGALGPFVTRAYDR